MGWRINNAWRLPAGADPFGEIEPLRQAVVPVQQVADAQEIADTAVSLVDQFSLHGDVSRLPMRGEDMPVDPSFPWVSAVRVLSYQESKISQTMADTDRHRCEIQFIRDLGDGRVYAICYADEESIRDAARKAMADRGWQDWGDKGIADGTWDRIIGDRAPAEVGLGLSIKPVGKFGTTPPMMGITDEEVQAIEQVQMRTVGQRLTRMALDVFLCRFSSGDVSQAISEMMDAYDSIDALAGTPGWASLVEKMIDLSVDDVRGHGEGPIIGHRLSEDDIAEVLATSPSLSDGDSTNTD